MAIRPNEYRVVRWGWLGLVLLLQAATCNSETLFQSAFASNALGSPPAHVQATGTINVDGPSGSVQVVAAPSGTTGNWARITRTNQQTSVTAMQCNLSPFRGDGSYGLIANVYIPTGAQVASLQFETFGQAPSDYTSFLHLDFLENNTVRINDEPGSTFGSFPRNQAFIVAVTLTINGSTTTAHVDLLGSASGSADHALIPPVFAHQFGAVRFWMGFPWTGSFYVGDVIVTRATQ
jgi:hypothetical protein